MTLQLLFAESIPARWLLQAMGTALADLVSLLRSSRSASGSELQIVSRLLDLLEWVPATDSRDVVAACMVRPVGVAAVELVIASPTSPAGPALLAGLLKQDLVAGDHARPSQASCLSETKLFVMAAPRDVPLQLTRWR